MMMFRHRTQSKALRRYLSAEAEEPFAGVTPIGAADHPGLRLHVLALLGVVLVLMFAPALVGVISMLNGNFFDVAAGRIGWQAGLTPFLSIALMGSNAALAVIVSKAREDQ